MSYSIEDLPVELVEPIGNVIRKICYTQLRTVRLVGLGISEDSSGKTYYLPTKPIEGTTTLLDIITRLIDCEVKDAVGNNAESTQQDSFVQEVDFTNLKSALSNFVDVSSLNDDLLITESSHKLRLVFKLITKDMSANDLQVIIPEGTVAIPCSVIRPGEFRLDNSRKEEGILTFYTTDNLGEQLVKVIDDLKTRFVINKS